MKQFETFVDVKSCSVSPLTGKKRLEKKFFANVQNFLNAATLLIWLGEILT